MAGLSGLPDYSFSVIAHPISDNSDEELRVKAAAAVNQCVTLLTGHSAAP